VRGRVEEEDEAMVSVKLLVRAVAVAMVSSAAYAADMPQQLPPPPQPQLTYQPMQLVMQQPAGAWYLRGYIGVGMTSQANFVFEPNPLNAPVDILTQHAAMGDTVFFGAGAGYEFNNWLRFDVTAEYRTKSSFNAFLTYDCGGGCVQGDQYNAFIKSDIFLANAYIDLGTWDCLTPFIGFGIGGAYNTFSDFTDTGIATSGNGVGTNASQLNFAWALHAGLAYNVTQNFSLELAYRYLSYGSVSDQIMCAGGCNPDTYKLQSLTSQDFMLGVRWRFPIESPPIMIAPQPAMMVQQPVQQAPVYAPPPVMVPQPAPVYAPPQYQPQYQPQYPLSTRG
jgi:opacity protein-like surface antigen